MAWGDFNAELLVRVFHHCDCPEKIVDPRLHGPKKRLKNGTCTAKRVLLQGVSFCIKPWKKLWEGVNAELLAQVFRDKCQLRDCPETLCAQDWSNGVQMLGNGTCTGESLLVGWVFNQT